MALRTLHAKHGIPPGEIGRRVKAERERKGLTQEAAAKEFGVSRGSYKQYEQSANPSYSTLLTFKKIGFDVRAIVPELFN